MFCLYGLTGYVSLHKLLRLVQSSCGIYRNFLIGEKELIDKEFSLVKFGSRYTFSPQLFDRAALDFPMRLRSWLSGVGRTSVDVYRVLETADSERTVLLSGVVRFVCMNFVNSTSVPFPDSLKRLLLSASSPVAHRFPSIKVPESAATGSFMTIVRVRYDDMDYNFHTNQACYMLFALECAAEAAAAGYYSRIREDIAFYRALSHTCVHLNESFAGDELNVSTWEGVDNPMLLHFIVTRQQQRIYYVEIEFNEKNVASKL